MKTVNIKKVFADIVSEVSASVLPALQAVDPLITGVHYEYGHYTDIQERLISYSKTSSKKQERYPLIAVFEDDKVTHTREGIYGVAGMKVLILALSNPNYTRVQRDEKTFEPILFPIYETLLDKIWQSGHFMVYSPDQIKHVQINRPHWGDPGLYKNESYLFGDVLDGIELNNLELPTYLKTCEAELIGS